MPLFNAVLKAIRVLFCSRSSLVLSEMTCPRTLLQWTPHFGENFRGLVLGGMGTYDSESRRIFFTFFEIYNRPYRAKKKVHTLFFSRKKNTFGGELRLERPSRQRRAPGAPWGLPTPDVRSTFGQRWVNVRSTLGQRSVTSLAIAGRFSLILPDSSMKTEDRRRCISQMVDFQIRKRDVRVRSWFGAFWEPLERKKKRKPNVFTRLSKWISDNRIFPFFSLPLHCSLFQLFHYNFYQLARI